MDHITNDTSLIGPCDVIPVGAQNPRFPVVGHREFAGPKFYSFYRFFHPQPISKSTIYGI